MDNEYNPHPAPMAIARCVLLTIVLGEDLAYLRQYVHIPEGLAQLARDTYPDISAVGAYLHGLNGLLWIAMDAIQNGMGIIEALIHVRLLPPMDHLFPESSDSDSSGWVNSSDSEDSEIDQSESVPSDTDSAPSEESEPEVEEVPEFIDSEEEKENDAPADYQKCKRGRPSSGYWSDEDPGPSPKALRTLRHFR